MLPPVPEASESAASQWFDLCKAGPGTAAAAAAVADADAAEQTRAADSDGAASWTAAPRQLSLARSVSSGPEASPWARTAHASASSAADEDAGFVSAGSPSAQGGTKTVSYAVTHAQARKRSSDTTSGRTCAARSTRSVAAALDSALNSVRTCSNFCSGARERAAAGKDTARWRGHRLLPTHRCRAASAMADRTLRPHPRAV